MQRWRWDGADRHRAAARTLVRVVLVHVTQVENRLGGEQAEVGHQRGQLRRQFHLRRQRAVLHGRRECVNCLPATTRRGGVSAGLAVTNGKKRKVTPRGGAWRAHNCRLASAAPRFLTSCQPPSEGVITQYCARGAGASARKNARTAVRRRSRVCRSARRSSERMMSRSRSGSTEFSTWSTSSSSKQRMACIIADTLRILSRNWFPSPAPSLAPRTRPAARAQSVHRAPQLYPAAPRTNVNKFQLRAHYLRAAANTIE